MQVIAVRALKTVDTQILGPAAKAVLQQSFLHRIQARFWRGLIFAGGMLRFCLIFAAFSSANGLMDVA